MTNIPNNPVYPQRPNPTPYNPGQNVPTTPGFSNGAAAPFGTNQPMAHPQTYSAPTPPTPQVVQTQPTTAQTVGAQAYQAVQASMPQTPATQATTSQTPTATVQAPMAPTAVQGYNPQAPSHQGTAYPTQTQTPVPAQQGQGQPSQGQPQESATGQGLTDRDREFEKEDKKLYHKRARIVKFATNKTYFEVFNFGFKHGRIAIKMSNYKPQYSEILISLKLGEYFELKDLIMSGAIHHRQPDKYSNLHFYNKGTASKYSKDGSVSARQLGIQRANDPSKYVVTFVAKEGPGKQDQKGLIQFVGKPNTTVIYPMTRAMLVEFFDTVDLHLQGYLSACYHYQFQNIPSFTKES